MYSSTLLLSVDASYKTLIVVGLDDVKWRNVQEMDRHLVWKQDMAI